MKISRTSLRHLINEIVDSVSGKIKVYHMFGKEKQSTASGQRYEMAKELVLDRVKTIMTKGFVANPQANFGEGLYGIDGDHLRNLAASKAGDYGNYALEFEIKDFSRYLVFNYEKAKEVKGEKYRIIDQFASMGLSPETHLYDEIIGTFGPEGYVQKSSSVTVRDLSEAVDIYNEDNDFIDNDTLRGQISELSINKSLNIDGCYVLDFFVCWNLKSVVLTGYCDDISSGEIKPLPNISMT